MTIKTHQSRIPFNYITIKTTKSRIDKGLLAIPVSLIHLFPKSSNYIYLIDENGNEKQKKFTPYNSSSHECRIGGLKSFYERFQIDNDEELVLQFLDEGKYKLIPEKIFENLINEEERKFEISSNEVEIEEQVKRISIITNSSTEEVLMSQFFRLSNKAIPKRKTIIKPESKVRDRVPLSLRIVLASLYTGKCQVSGFTFIMKNGLPYFEIHHIDELNGNHLKNLLVVSPNVHAQFTHANVEHEFDQEGWLRNIKINNIHHSVFQKIDTLPKRFEKEMHD